MNNSGICIRELLEYFKIDAENVIVFHDDLDINFGKTNTLYTYAFVVQKLFKGNGYAKILKRVYLNWAKKQEKIQFITGHVIDGVSSKFTGNIRIIDRIENWQGTGKIFEYYRRELDPDRIYAPRTDPPNITRV